MDAPPSRPARAPTLGAERPGLLTACLGAIFLMAGPAVAQSLLMRSGEHATFTRLTLPVSAEEPWQLGRTGDGYGLRLPEVDAEIDTSGVFARIPRGRLAALRPTDAGIDLVLSCSDCHANAFQEGRLLVIDIRDGAAPPDARYEARLVDPRQPSLPARPAFDWTRRFGAAPTLAAPVPMADAAEPVAAGAPIAAYSADPGLARDLLARQFARAAAQGLIAVDPATPGGVAAVAGGTAPDRLEVAQAALRNLRIDAETALDRARRSDTRRGTDRDGAACPADHLFDFAAWAGDAPLTRQIAALRGALMGEFDRPVEDSVADLARLYLHAGFGAEAAHLLTTLPLAPPRQDLLRDLARLIDEATPLADSPLLAYVGCDGPAALWAVLATADLRTAGVIDRAAVQRAFAVLPLHLRRHLGPPLAQRFLDISDAETAQAIRNAIDRGQGVDAPGLAVLDAGLEMARGRPDAASVRAAQAATGNAPGAAEALAVMAEARLAAGLALAPGTTSDLVALAHEHRGTPLGGRLARLEALALAESGRFDAAFSVRNRLRSHDADAEAVDGLSLELIAVLSDRADEEGLLRRALAEPVWRGGRLPPEPRVQLASRLLDAGFPEYALDAFSGIDPPDAAAAVVMAQAALALDAPGEALRAVAGIDTPEAVAQRGAALLALGDARSAASVLSDAGLTAEARRAAWLGGDWAEVARRAEGADRQLAARTQTAAELAPEEALPAPEAEGRDLPWPPAPSEGALAEARGLLEGSAELRDLVASLMTSHPPPAD